MVLTCKMAACSRRFLNVEIENVDQLAVLHNRDPNTPKIKWFGRFKLVGVEVPLRKSLWRSI